MTDLVDIVFSLAFCGGLTRLVVEYFTMYVIPLPVGPVHVTLKVRDPFSEDGVTVTPVTLDGAEIEQSG